MENNRLIAYNILKRNIIDNGFCTGCGACEATCPVNALQVEDVEVKRLYDCSKSIDLCPICNEVCPHSQALLLRSQEAVTDAPFRSEAVGYFRKILLAQANDPKIREESSDGAVVTTLLTHGVENKIFDSAVVSRTDPANPLKPKPLVALTSQEITSASGSKFFASTVLKAYGSAVFEYSRKDIVVVGLPCQVLGLRKIDAWQHKISDKAKIKIGLFCFGTFSLKPFLNYVQNQYGISAEDINGMHVARDLTLYTKQGPIEIPLPEARQHITTGCKTCIDYTSEVADISVGNAYPLEEWSIVIIRTKAGEEFFNSAVQKGVMNTRRIEKEPEVFERLIVAALQKRTAGLIRASKLAEMLEFVPVRLLRETDALAGVKVEEIMSKEVVTVSSSMTVNDLLTMMATKTFIGYPVIDQKGELVGVVTMEEATKVDKAERWRTPVASIARPNLDVCYLGDTALDVVRKMRKLETGRVLILDPADPKKILGIVTKRDIMHALVKETTKGVF
ncbi:MAG TPA: Coenzyme F420 hydrogenase/dehydrogenase, beta subunit C-terminal domain [Candidatus Acidoferrales bacterium]|nr:Coenzyme F420 hydrogenase/dehydrogenase, beta subunit C-terminal domain [Candidatus Acidoferrales bacterium]